MEGGGTRRWCTRRPLRDDVAGGDGAGARERDRGRLAGGRSPRRHLGVDPDGERRGVAQRVERRGRRLLRTAPPPPAPLRKPTTVAHVGQRWRVAVRLVLRGAVRLPAPVLVEPPAA